jgi:hypothetical protein
MAEQVGGEAFLRQQVAILGRPDSRPLLGSINVPTLVAVCDADVLTPVAKRIVRAKAKSRDARIPYHVPSREELPDRLDVVLQVIYLVFTEGYSASSGGWLTRPDLSGEAIRLGRLLTELLPEPEAVGCSRCWCCTNRGAPRVPRRLVSSCC